MFTKNVDFELVYILTIGTVYWCHRDIMLNYFIFSGNWVKYLIKRRHSLVFSTFWNYVLLTGCRCEERAPFFAAHAWGLHSPLPHSHCSFWYLSSPLQTPCSCLPQSCFPGLKCLLSRPSVSSSGAIYSIKLSSPFDQNHDANKCKQPLNLTTSFCSWGSKLRVNWPCRD